MIAAVASTRSPLTRQSFMNRSLRRSTLNTWYPGGHRLPARSAGDCTMSVRTEESASRASRRTARADVGGLGALGSASERPIHGPVVARGGAGLAGDPRAPVPSGAAGRHVADRDVSVLRDPGLSL